MIRIDGEEAVEIARVPRGRQQHCRDCRQCQATHRERCASRCRADLELKPLYDQSIFIRQATDEVMKSALEGGLLAVLVIYLFLRNAAVTAIVSVSIPVSVIATFNVM